MNELKTKSEVKSTRDYVLSVLVLSAIWLVVLGAFVVTMAINVRVLLNGQ